jgi:hypothetical protein
VSRLPDIQDAFQRFLLTGSPGIDLHVVGTQRVPVATRLAIYGDGYRSRLTEALQASFPVLANLLGETDFDTLALRYVGLYQSTFFSIRYYGAQLADFLAADEEYSKAPLLAELARLEWAMAAAFDAADNEPIGSDAFAQLSPEDWAELRFEWSPSVQVVELEWNVPQLWKAVTEETERPEPALLVRADPQELPSPDRDGPTLVSGLTPVSGPTSVSSSAPASSPTTASYLIWRRELQIYFRPLPVAEAAVIAAARAGHSFGELCVLLCEHLDDSEASLQAAGFLRGWVESGLLIGARVPAQ